MINFLIFHHSVGITDRSRQSTEEYMQQYMNNCTIDNFGGYDIKNIFTTNKETDRTEIELIFPIDMKSNVENQEEFKGLKRKLKILNFIELIENEKETDNEEKIAL